jgi:hypothetical protein
MSWSCSIFTLQERVTTLEIEKKIIDYVYKHKPSIVICLRNRMNIKLTYI